MKKRKKNKKLHRTSGQRKALIKSLILSLIKKEAITTTLARAKELKPTIEKLITKCNKKDKLNARREIQKIIPKEGVAKFIEDIAPRFKERAGGYTRILKLGPRKSDDAEMARIEFVK